MAIARGAGTEIIRTAHFEDVDALQPLIIGEQHQCRVLFRSQSNRRRTTRYGR